MPTDKKFASRAGIKLLFALESFDIDVKGLICADFGCSTGGFTDCLIQNGASKVYSVDTAYGELDYNLRNDQRVIVRERSNAMHIVLDEKVDLITVDTAWTKQEKVIPNVLLNLKPEGRIISLVKPHYESMRNELSHGVVKPECMDDILSRVEEFYRQTDLKIISKIQSPIEGRRAGNIEWLYYLEIV